MDILTQQGVHVADIYSHTVLKTSSYAWSLSWAQSSPTATGFVKNSGESQA